VDELLFTAPEYQALLKPSDGGTLAALDFRPTSSTLINSILRRPEPYHSRLRDPNYRPATSTASAYEQTRVKESGLDRFLQYDRWPRHSFRIFVFDPSRTAADYEALHLQEDAGFAAGLFTVDASSSQDAELVRHAVIAWPGDKSGSGAEATITKHFSLGPAPRGCEVACELRVKFKSAIAKPIAIGLESVVNLLAPDAADRFFETPDGPQNLRFTGAVPGPTLRMEDGWQGVKVALHAPGAQHFWVAPIETVSESEEGFERVYQGSQILAAWYPDFAKEKSWLGRLVWRVEEIPETKAKL
jgi:alpha-amylase